MAQEAPQAGPAFTLSVKKSILGAKVIDSQGHDVGKIEDLVLDPADGRAIYAIVSLGGFLSPGDEHFPVPWQSLGFDQSEKIAVLNVEKERFETAPRFHREKWPDMTDAAWRDRLHRHYVSAPHHKK